MSGIYPYPIDPYLLEEYTRIQEEVKLEQAKRELPHLADEIDKIEKENQKPVRL